MLATGLVRQNQKIISNKLKSDKEMEVTMIVWLQKKCCCQMNGLRSIQLITNFENPKEGEYTFSCSHKGLQSQLAVTDENILLLSRFLAELS